MERLLELSSRRSNKFELNIIIFVDIFITSLIIQKKLALIINTSIINVVFILIVDGNIEKTNFHLYF